MIYRVREDFKNRKIPIEEVVSDYGLLGVLSSQFVPKTKFFVRYLGSTREARGICQQYQIYSYYEMIGRTDFIVYRYLRNKEVICYKLSGPLIFPQEEKLS